jgi:hypothetical protein
MSKRNYKLTRRSYTYIQKIEILKNLKQSGCNVSTFAKKINIPIRTLQKWQKQIKKITDVDGTYLNNKKIRAGRLPICYNIEILLLQWIKDIRSMGLPINDKLIIRRAFFLKKTLNITTDCVFSNGWLEGFKNRHHVVNRKASSKIIRKDVLFLAELQKFVNMVTEKINSNMFSSIINIDETGIYYDSKIDFTLDIQGTKRIEIK